MSGLGLDTPTGTGGATRSGPERGAHRRLSGKALRVGIASTVVGAVVAVLIVVSGGSPASHPSAKVPLRATPAVTTAGRFVQCVTNTFFGNPGRLTAIEARMGKLLLCGRATDGNQWVAIFGGKRPNPAANFRTGSTPGGPPLYLPTPFGGWSIATLTCTTSVNSCLDQTATHDFEQFTVHLPPTFGGGFDRLPSTTAIYGTTMIAFLSLGSCPARLVFNTPNDSWYRQPPGNPDSAIAAMESGNTSAMPRFLPQPPTMTGRTALAASNPSTLHRYSNCPPIP